MHITIKHRDELAGLLGDKRKYLVDVNVDFSQEERAIIEKRKLYDTQLDLSPGFLASSVFFLSTPLIIFGVLGPQPWRYCRHSRPTADVVVPEPLPV